MNVLVVDDDREIVDSISIFLSGEGYRALKAYDGIEALDILSEQEVHLMILDIMMPRLDGIKTLMKLRESRNIPVILLSAKSEDADKIFGLTAGLPVNLEGLVGANGKVWGLESFGFSAPYKVLDEKLGFTAENVYNQVKSML